MFNAQYYENSLTRGVAMLEVVEAAEDETGAARFVPLQRTLMQGQINGPLADLQVIHHFGYTRSACDQTLEAIYRFPLPGDAAVTGVVVRFGEVEIVAELKAQTEAKADYERAVREGRQAALALRAAADAFTLRLAGLQPDQPIVVTTSYIQLARAEGGGWQLRIPLTLAPRFVRRDEPADAFAGQPLGLLRDPGHRFSLDLTLAAVDALHSDSHELAVTTTSAGQQIRLQAGDVIPDRDFVLKWTPHHAAAHPLLTVFTYVEPDAEFTYFLALAAPPSQRLADEQLAREVILLIDHSGSMTGPKWAAADWTVERFLGDLRPADRFALGYFHNTTHWFAATLQAATPEQTQQATAWLHGQSTSGGTELGIALEQALQLARTPQTAARDILLVTDAEVTDAGRILRLADGEAQNPQRRRISVLCIDAAPNAYLAQALADRGGGVARFLTSDPKQGDITTALDEILDDWAQPILTNVALQINRGQVESGGQRSSQVDPHSARIDLGDLVAGRARWVVGRTVHQELPAITFALVDAAGNDLTTATAPTSSVGTAALKALFGARRVTALEQIIAAKYDEATVRDHLIHLGYDPDVVLAAAKAAPPSLYPENQQRPIGEALNALLQREALRYHLASTATAFVATRREAGEVVAGTVAVANALPAGWSSDFLLPGVAAAPAMSPAMSAQMFGAGPMDAGIVSVGRSVMSSAAYIAPPQGRQPMQVKQTTIFAGLPTWAGDKAVLYDAAQIATLPDQLTFTALEVTFAAPGDAPQVAKAAYLAIYVADPSTPRARIRLRDLIRVGQRPLNIGWSAGQQLTLVLHDPDGTLARLPVELTVVLYWRA